jgi:hypothetical protein
MSTFAPEYASFAPTVAHVFTVKLFATWKLLMLPSAGGGVTVALSCRRTAALIVGRGLLAALARSDFSALRCAVMFRPGGSSLCATAAESRALVGRELRDDHVARAAAGERQRASAGAAVHARRRRDRERQRPGRRAGVERNLLSPYDRSDGIVLARGGKKGQRNGAAKQGTAKLRHRASSEEYKCALRRAG